MGGQRALAPGGVDQHLTRLRHHTIERPMYPYCPEMADRDLHAQVVVP